MMPACTITDRRILGAIGHVLDRISAACPLDARKVMAGVRLLEYLAPEERYMGGHVCSGQYVADGTPVDSRYCIGPGAVKLWHCHRDDDELVATIAHELGHAITTAADVRLGMFGDPVWDVEAAADRHASRWGFAALIAADIGRRAPGACAPAPGKWFMRDMTYYRTRSDYTCACEGRVGARPASAEVERLRDEQRRRKAA